MSWVSLEKLQYFYDKLKENDLDDKLELNIGDVDPESAGLWFNTQGTSGDAEVANQVFTMIRDDILSLVQENALKPSELMDKIYPVGSIYMSVNNVSPATFLGGTWVALQNRFLLGAGDSYEANTTGGEASHTLTIDEMPSHDHFPSKLNGDSDLPIYFDASWGSSITGQNLGTTTQTTNNGFYFYNNPEGGSQPHNNIPPYLAVYMWKRTE